MQDYVYILEFKFDKSADEALQQIEDKQYAKPLEHDGRTVYKMGVNFSSQTRRIVGREIQGYFKIRTDISSQNPQGCC